jgi:enoyl-CoA hydratase/carnithine racemase
MPVSAETVQPGVRVLTIDRTAKRNAFDIALYNALAQGISDADGDPDVRVMVITGRGGVFTSGNDLADFRDYPDSVAPFALLRTLVEAENPLSPPLRDSRSASERACSCIATWRSRGAQPCSRCIS